MQIWLWNDPILTFEDRYLIGLLYYIFSMIECLIIICGNYPIIISDNCHVNSLCGGRTGLMVRASDSGSGDPGSILGRVGVFVSLSKRHLLPKKVLVIPRNRWLRLNMTEKLFTGTLNHNQNKKQKKTKFFVWGDLIFILNFTLIHL